MASSAMSAGRNHHQVAHGAWAEQPAHEPLVSDPKMHSPHAQSLRSRLIDPFILLYRQARVTQVPAGSLFIVAVLAFCLGSFFNTIADLPTPDSTPQVKQVLTSGSIVGSATRKALMLGATGQAVAATTATAATSGGGGAAAKKGALDPMTTEGFERFALSNSGFDKLRPALTPADSGNAAMQVIPFQTLSYYPRLTYYPAFVDKERCEHIIALAKRHLAPSTLAYRPGESIPETQNVRTSSGTFLSREMDAGGVLTWLEDKIAAVTHLPAEYGEAFNALRYMPTQHYDSHYDSFAESQYGKQNSQRIATFLLFLSDVEEGGETVFKREGRNSGNRTITDWRTCDDGFGVRVKPKQGDAVLFWSARPDLTLDDHALHGACPVIKGEKWSIAKWIHEKPMGMPRH